MGFAAAMTCLLLLGPTSVRSRAQEGPPPAQDDARRNFFSGNVTELAEGRVVVGRSVLGRPAETRAFVLTGDTKVEGTLRVAARVTVQFATQEGTEVAVRIVVRSPGRN